DVAQRAQRVGDSPPFSKQALDCQAFFEHPPRRGMIAEEADPHAEVVEHAADAHAVADLFELRQALFAIRPGRLVVSQVTGDDAEIIQYCGYAGLVSEVLQDGEAILEVLP